MAKPKPGNRNEAGQFVKGQSGNPSGRAKMPEELKAKLREGANKAVKYWLQLAEDEKAKPEHRLKAAENLVNYAYGKPIQQVDADINAQTEIKTVQLSMQDKLELVKQAISEAKKE